MTKAFQSTPPVKAATHAQGAYHTAVGISIHAAREGGDLGFSVIFKHSFISIHAAREGGDGFGINASAIILYFNPRRP